MHAYAILQVIEERAVTQFGMMLPILEKTDPKSAAVIRGIAKDEERHLKYCHAISAQYAPDSRTLAETVIRLRQAESLAFAENSRAQMAHSLNEGLLDLGPVGKAFWRGILALGARAQTEARTPFWNPGQTMQA